MGCLTEAKIKALHQAGRYRDGDCLFLNVTPAGTRSWVVRVKLRHGPRRDLGIGPYPLLSLKEARIRAWEYRKQAFNGVDPLGERKRAAMPTFQHVARQYYEENKPRWKAGRNTDQWLRAVEKYALPVFGHKPVDRLDQDDILAVLRPIWTTIPETARKLRQQLRVILKWCQAHRYVKENVAGDVIAGALAPMPSIQAHHRSLPYEAVGAALERIEASGASVSAKLCLRLLILTATRSQEARGMRWQELDTEKRLWTIPASRMKTNHEHHVPLSDEAMRVLDRARILEDGSGFVFPSQRKKGDALCVTTLTRLLATTGLLDQTVVHGFRSSFRTWSEEQTHADFAVKEQALAHQVGSSIERAYTRTDLLTKRRRLMQQWSDYITSAPRQQVVSLHG